jgi:hypothetical protein
MVGLCLTNNTTDYLMDFSTTNAFNSQFISVIGPTRYTICCQFITINSLYMFQALISSSSGGTVYKGIGVFYAYYVGRLLAGLEWNW